jgi:uncharacterized protein YidB (DUF937 family)
MALLDELLGGVLRSALGGSGNNAGSGKAALIQAVLAMLMQGGLGGGQQQPGGQQQGGLGSILGGLLGGGDAPATGQGTGPGVPPGMGGLGNILAGGLGGLGQIFEQAGMGDHVKSWMSTDQNMPLSPDQVSHALGSDRLGQLAEAAGMSKSDTAHELSQILPQLVDGMTPGGGVPQGQDVSQDDLGQLVSRVLAGGR